MALPMSRFARSIKKPHFGFSAKVSLVVLLGLSFVVFWSIFSSPSSTVLSQRSSFDDIESEREIKQASFKQTHNPPVSSTSSASGSSASGEKGNDKEEKEEKLGSKESDHGDNAHSDDRSKGEIKERTEVDEKGEEGTASEQQRTDETVKEEEIKKIEEVTDGEGVNDGDIDGGADDSAREEEHEGEGEAKNDRERGTKISGPLFDPKVHYNWRLCSGRIGHNYIPCIDLEGTGTGKLQSHRHHERSCPAAPPLCLVPLPNEYESPIPWPECKDKIFYRNVAHPKLSAYLKTQHWSKLSDGYLIFPGNESVLKGGATHYLDFIDELVPDIAWGKNIRIVLDIGCTDASFAFSLLEKDVLTLCLGSMGDETDLAQLSLERGIPAILGNLGTRKLPFPYGVFDAIHCGDCNIPWHSNGGRILLEMNRMLRPGGYFVTSFEHGDIEREEAMSKLIASICWNVLAHKTDDETDLSVKIYQRPSSNDVYELRRMKGPPLCKNEESEAFVWYTPIEKCLHTIPAAIEQRGTDWPEEWPKRLEAFPEWLADSQERLTADTEHWKAIISKSYLNGLGIDWSRVRNVMDMKAIYGGFAAALSSQKVWVMNVVPLHAPNTLPIIYERGLLGIYHDWCESFSTYPRSYDLLHADHLFSRLKRRCKKTVSIVVEMDRILRPGGWAIIRDKLEILDPLEAILRELHWEITMTFSHNKQGIICAQKTSWRP